VDERVTLLAALAAGALSFLSPGVLPFIPSYLSFVSGSPAGDLRASRARVLVPSLAFAAGFALVFVALGASATLVGQVLAERLTWVGRLAGVIVVLFGLHALGALRAVGRALRQRNRLSQEARPLGPAGAGLVGAAFGVGWTPCVGPILAGVLTLAGVLESTGAGARLLGAYSAGLALPFLATSLFLGPWLSTLDTVRTHARTIEHAAGALLIVLGLAILTNRIALLSGWLTF
jgi:cytochrome c-type biogenesis protein